jgi:two-component system response regulator FlrC
MSKAVILVVEDDAELRDALCHTLALAGYRTETADDGATALELLARKEIAMVITDIQMPGMDGHALLKQIKAQRPELPVMLMTAYGSIAMAVEAMRDGAVDYLSKPFEAEVLAATVAQYLGDATDAGGDDHAMVAVDVRSRELAKLAQRVAASDATVMLTGESGVGKEVLARYIHAHSPRRHNRFVAINCAAIPDNMLEATLFGYEKGAFTGAYKACPGKFELAQGGTILLDEISEMDAALQAKLLRVLQERQVERLGGHTLTDLDVRVLATSNRNMRSEVNAGRFREDLFYRLNVFPLQIPALRERRQDIVPLAERLLQKHARQLAAAAPVLSEEARARLLTHNWPGNVRELENVIQRALILHSGATVNTDDIQFEIMDATADTGDGQAVDEAASLGDEMKHHEYSRILAVLKADNGNRKSAAEKLGISQRTLRYKLARMREIGMSIPGRYGMEGI